MNTRYTTYILILILGIAAFYWGFNSHKNKTFPYGLLETKSQTAPDIREVKLDAEALKTLPYVMGKPVSRHDETSDGILISEPELTYKGYNLFLSAISETAYLMDMEGEIRHEWTGDKTIYWHHASVDDKGNLFAVRYRDGLVKLDIDSNIIFDLSIRAHHDLALAPDGDIYVITDKLEPFNELYGDETVNSDYITHVSESGEVIGETSLIQAIFYSPYRMLLPTFTEGLHRMEGLPDILHTNSIEVLDGRSRSASDARFRKGNILFSCREINFIGILNPETGEVVWGWGGSNIYRQHHASMLPNGNILMFDNGLARSRVIEINPQDGKLAWEYNGGKDELFFSRTKGAAQRLPNGNTLITVADECFVMEVTPEGRVVWKYLNPMMFEDDGSLKRQAYYRVIRIPKRNPDIYM